MLVSATLVLSLQAQVSVLCLYVGLGDLNLRSHACVANTFPADSFPSPCYDFLYLRDVLLEGSTNCF